MKYRIRAVLSAIVLLGMSVFIFAVWGRVEADRWRMALAVCVVWWGGWIYGSAVRGMATVNAKRVCEACCYFEAGRPPSAPRYVSIDGCTYSPPAPNKDGIIPMRVMWEDAAGLHIGCIYWRKRPGWWSRFWRRLVGEWLA